MYVAKERGRNNFQFFSSEMNSQAASQAEFETRLRLALLREELSIHYQPQYDLGSGQIVAVEALLRWHDAAGSEIPAARIIRCAEESGLIHPLGRWVLETVIRQAGAWTAAGWPPLRVAVNVSGHQIRQGNFIDQIDLILEETGFPAEQLEIELTETAMMGHIPELLPTLTDLKVRGLPVAIYDFGTGYSSLLYLAQLW